MWLSSHVVVVWLLVQVLESGGEEEGFAINSKTGLSSADGDLTDGLEGWLSLLESTLDRVDEVEVLNVNWIRHFYVLFY